MGIEISLAQLASVSVIAALAVGALLLLCGIICAEEPPVA
jgi:hypothetical protein